ncbi:hypothetical protein EW145_g6236 [Phellinidium pouzarii]|uniref:Uncharacterized protein n=1 Tax=Phellinidium pouzarii TaxID=167371 RepID=A0A4S4KZ08_9AGAM|nr:hypothetical protein EW145_g6236 [Phellinidium pouzarii]
MMDAPDFDNDDPPHFPLIPTPEMYANAGIPVPGIRLHASYRNRPRDVSPTVSETEIANLARKVREKVLEQHFEPPPESKKKRGKKNKEMRSSRKKENSRHSTRPRKAISTNSNDPAEEQVRGRSTTSRLQGAESSTQKESTEIPERRSASPLKRTLDFIVENFIPPFLKQTDGFGVSTGNDSYPEPSGTFSNAPGAYPSSFIAPSSSRQIPDSSSTNKDIPHVRGSNLDELFKNADVPANKEQPRIFVASKSFLEAQHAAQAASKARYKRNSAVKKFVARALADERARVASAIAYAEQCAKEKRDLLSRPQIGSALEMELKYTSNEERTMMHEDNTESKCKSDDEEQEEDDDDEESFVKQLYETCGDIISEENRKMIQEEFRVPKEQRENPDTIREELGPAQEMEKQAEDIGTESFIQQKGHLCQNQQYMRRGEIEGPSKRWFTDYLRFHPYPSASTRFRRSRNSRHFVIRRPQPNATDSVEEIFTKHERLWTRLLSPLFSATTLCFEDIPWPLLFTPRSPSDVTEDGVSRFLLHPYRSSAMKKYDMRTELLRWWPENFQNNVFGRITDRNERVRVQFAANIVLKVLISKSN